MTKSELESLISFLKSQIIGLEYKAEREQQELQDLYIRLEDAQIDLAALQTAEDFADQQGA